MTAHERELAELIVTTLNLEMPAADIDPDAPLGIALLEPVHGTMLRVLCVDGDAVFPTTVDASHIAAVSRTEPVWYPYAAGSFGAEMML